MKHKKLFITKGYLLLVIMLMGAMGLAACSGDTTEEPVAEELAEEPAAKEPTEEPMEEPTEEPAEEPTEEPTEEPVAEEPEVSITIWVDDTHASILAALGEEFQAAYGVGLIVEQVADIRNQFVINAPTGEGPDIIVGAHDWLGQLVASGLLAPMNLGDKADAFTDVSLTGFTFDGQLYGMPYATENVAFFYNTDLVETPPTTWDEVVGMGTALQESGDVTFGLALTGTTYDAFPLQTAFGGYVFGRDDAGNYDPSDVGIDSEGMIAAGDWMAEQIAAGFMSDNTDWDTSHTLFETGEIPFLMAGPRALNRIRESGVPYGITTFPDGGRPLIYVQGFMVNALSENALLAQVFLTDFVATDTVMAEISTTMDRPSSFIPTLEATDDADIAAFGEASVYGVIVPPIPEMDFVWGPWGDAFTLIAQGVQGAENALSDSAQKIRDLVGGAASGMVNVPGSWQPAAGFDCEWDTACADTALTEADGLYTGSFSLPAGDYEVKVAHEGGWYENYGVDGVSGGDNYQFTMAADGTVTFTYDPETHILEIATE